MPAPATRLAAWRWRPAPAQARPGCWSRACSEPCSMAPSLSRSWPSPSRARPLAKCARAWKSGWCSTPAPTARRCSASRLCWTAACRRLKPRRQSPCWPTCMSACCAADAVSRCTPSMPGLRNCSATHPWRCWRSWACRPGMRSSKTRRPWKRPFFDASTAVSRRTPPCASPTSPWC